VPLTAPGRSRIVRPDQAPFTSMTHPEDDEPLAPDQARIVARVRWLMLISGFATVLGIAVVLGVVGYRMFRSAGTSTAGTSDLVALLPKGAKIIATAAAGDALIVTIEIGGTTEIRSFDARTLAPLARLRFATEP
jgi:hypothetical protein